GTEPTGWLNGRNRRQAPLGSVECHKCPNVHVGQSITVRATEVFTGHVFCDTLETSTGLGVEPGVDEGDTPRFSHGLMDFHPVLAEVEGDVRHVEEIIGEELFDDVALVAATDHEFGYSVGG